MKERIRKGTDPLHFARKAQVDNYPFTPRHVILTTKDIAGSYYHDASRFYGTQTDVAQLN